MTSRKLKYFEWNGLGEAIRYIFLYTGKEFEDIRVDLRIWPDEELRASLPFGKFPVLEEDGKELHQSMAIARYAAVGTELLPSDPWEQAVLDAVTQTAYDFAVNYILKYAFEMDPIKKEAILKKFYDEDLDYYLSRFEKKLNENNGYFGGKLSWADFYFVGIIEASNTYLKDNIEKNYPAISELIKKINSLPGVKEYVANRKPYIPYHLYKLAELYKK